MTHQRPNFCRKYLAALQTLSAAEDREAVLQRAYELGRLAIARGLGVLDMARIHHESLERILLRTAQRRDTTQVLKSARAFLLEALSPFEVTHRGFRETNRRLQQVVATLEKRNLQLARANTELEAEIGEHKRTQKALQASEARIQAILNHSPAVIFLKTPDGRYLHVNPQFERLFGLRSPRIVGRTDAELFPPSQAAVFRANDREVLRLGGPVEFEETARYHDGIHTSIVSKFPLRDNRGKVYAICGIATDITERKAVVEALEQSEQHYHRLFQEAQAMQESLRNLSRQVLHVQEQERNRISRELHDEVGQALTGISMNLEAIRNNGVGNSPLCLQKLADSQGLLQQTMESVHRFARELRPAMLDELGLLPALRSYFTSVSRRTGLQISFRADSLAEKLDPEQKTVLFRVAQESLTNVTKHAQATQARVTLLRLPRGICLEVRDNGNGRSRTVANGAEPQGSQRLGLLGMQERVRLVNGTFLFQLSPGKGSVVRVVIPLKAAPLRRTHTQPSRHGRFLRRTRVPPAHLRYGKN